MHSPSLSYAGKKYSQAKRKKKLKLATMRELEKSQRFGTWEGRWGRAARALAGKGGDGGQTQQCSLDPKSTLRKGQEGLFFFSQKNPGPFPLQGNENSVPG